MTHALLIAVLAASLLGSAHAATCPSEDFQRHVSGETECLLMRSFGNPEPDTLLVWLHGDLSGGGNADYHFAHAEASAAEFKDRKVLAVALVRPGYPDGTGESSTVAMLQGGRSDHYTSNNLLQVGMAIDRLKSHYKAQRVVAVGHSGGAATVASLLGLRPGLIDAAVLVACPCDLAQWRLGRRAWSRSEDPAALVPRIAPGTTVIALTGARDDNTAPSLAAGYVRLLNGRGLKAEFREIPDAGHNSAMRASEVIQAIRELL